MLFRTLLLVSFAVFSCTACSVKSQPPPRSAKGGSTQARAKDTRGLFSAVVVEVKDGDTVFVKSTHNPREELRLQSVDCPEWDTFLQMHQPYGDDAAAFVRKEIDGTTVTIIPIEKDFLKRTVAIVVCADGELLADKIVAAGAGWWYKQYAPKNETLPILQADAKREKRGLWLDPKAVPPWEFRKKFFKDFPEKKKGP